MATTSINAVTKQSDNKGQFKWQRCGKNHNKGECKVPKVKCHKCGRVGHFAKMCKSNAQGKQTNSIAHSQPRPIKLTYIHLVSDEGQNLGTTDWATANILFEGIAWTDCIDIFPDTSGNINYHSRDVEVDNVCQIQKSHTFTYVNMYPTSLQGKNACPAQQVKCKIDSAEAVANVLSLGDYKKVNPSEFDKAGNSLVRFSNDRITLKAHGGKTIQQYGIRVLNYQWENKLIKPIFHIVELRDTYCKD